MNNTFYTIFLPIAMLGAMIIGAIDGMWRGGYQCWKDYKFLVGKK